MKDFDELNKVFSLTPLQVTVLAIVFIIFFLICTGLENKLESLMNYSAENTICSSKTLASIVNFVSGLSVISICFVQLLNLFVLMLVLIYVCANVGFFIEFIFTSIIYIIATVF